MGIDISIVARADASLTQVNASTLRSLFLLALGSFIVVSGCASVPIANAQTQVEGASMQGRIGQWLSTAAAVGDAEAATGLAFQAVEIATANMFVLPSKANVELTTSANEAAIEMANRLVAGLADLAQRFSSVGDEIFAAKTMIEYMQEVSAAAAPFTVETGDGDPVPDALQPLLDHLTGHEVHSPQARIVRVGFEVKLRGPAVPPFNRRMEEDVRVIEPIVEGECAVVFKETKGLMLRLILVRMTVVADPWATPMLARGTLIPVWALQWVPSEYVKVWSMCNQDGVIRTDVQQRVKQDIPLNYFWRFYTGSRSKGH